MKPVMTIADHWAETARRQPWNVEMICLESVDGKA